jgi:Mn-dependent DtxR family transcriptional regulator
VQEKEETAIAEPVTLSSLPDVLLDETITTKLIWLYLRSRGLVSYSTRKLAAALYLSQPAVSAGLRRLRDRELRLLEDVGKQRARVRSVYRAIDPEGAVPSRASTVDSKDPPLLPTVLAQATPTVKLVYVYLEPRGEVEMSVRQLEALLGVSHRPAAEAMARLVKLGLVEALEQPSNQPGRYRL